MLELAINYADELKTKMQSIWFDEKYKYYNSQNYYSEFNIADNTWSQHQYVSVDSNNKVIGFIDYSINRQTNAVSNVGIISFSNNKLTFARDLISAFKDIFDKFRFHKINFFVILGNPTEKHYDKMVEKCGGRIVGIYKQDVKLIDNKLYDIKIYEITRTDYYTKQAADLIKKLGNTV